MYRSKWFGDCTEEPLIENLSQKSERPSEEHKQISINTVAKEAELSITILYLSDIISKIIEAIIQNGEACQEKHRSLILRIKSGIHTMRTVQDMINFSKFDDLQDILISLEKNFGKFYSEYITNLNNFDPNKTLIRPEDYS